MQALLALFLAAQAPPATSPDRQAETLTQNVESRERGLKDLEADFEQHYRSAAIGREIVEKGKLSLKLPGRMVFDYASPEKKTFVSDGKTSFFYVPQEHQVIVQTLKGEKGLLSALLTGEGSLLERFSPSLVAGEEKRDRIRLEPKASDPDIDHLFVDVDESLFIRRIEIWDTQGNRTEFRFDKIRTNLGLSDHLFHFDIPKDVEVVEG